MARGAVARGRLLVADTNVLVSGLCWSGPPAAIVDECLHRRLTLVSSLALLDEFARVVTYPKLEAHLPAEAPSLVRLVTAAAVVVTPTRPVTAASDPTDNRVLEAAVAGDVDMIATGDRRHLRRLDRFRGIPIRTPAEIVEDWGLRTSRPAPAGPAGT